MHVYIECVLLLLQYPSVWLTKRARNHRESVHRSLCFSKEEPIFINPSVSVYFCACVCPFLLQYLWKTWCTSVRERGGGIIAFWLPVWHLKNSRRGQAKHYEKRLTVQQGCQAERQPQTQGQTDRFGEGGYSEEQKEREAAQQEGKVQYSESWREEGTVQFHWFEAVGVGTGSVREGAQRQTGYCKKMAL